MAEDLMNALREIVRDEVTPLREEMRTHHDLMLSSIDAIHKKLERFEEDDDSSKSELRREIDQIKARIAQLQARVTDLEAELEKN